MFTESMLRLFAIVLNRDGEKVTEALLMSGVMQFITSHSFAADYSTRELSDVAPSSDTAVRLAETRRRIESFLASVSITPDIPPETDTAASPACNVDDINRQLNAIADELQKVRDRQRLVQTDILKYEEIQRQLGMYGPDFSPETLHANYSYVAMQLGSLATERQPVLQEQVRTLPAVLVPVGETGGRTHLMAISMKRDRERIAILLANNGWQPIEVTPEMRGVKSEMTGAIDTKLRSLREEQARLQKTGRTVVTVKKEMLIETWVRLRIDELRIRITSAFRHSSHTVLFSGWVPASQKRPIADLLKRATGNHCYIEWFSPGQTSDLQEEKTEAPVKFRNPKALAPFQMLVANFGIPEYGTIDPTPFVVVTYLTMFGLMFADIGQGAILALLGIAGSVLFKKRKRAQRDLAALLIWCGGASMLFGTLFGSVFGYSIVKPLWFDFHGIVTGLAHPAAGISSIFDILGITIKFGIAVISCGLLFNWINLIIKRRWTELVFDKGGLLGGWIYTGGIYCAWYMIGHGYKEFPDAPVLLLSTALPALLLFFKGPLHARSHQTPLSAMTVLNFAMEWVVELLEVFSGYLSNTLSFMRVAGLGIAHVSLMVSFFTMAEMMRGTSPGLAASVASVLLIVAGNIMVITLEGLSAGIQALRLNYYEFFTKFFHGTGRLYQPVSLREP